MSKNTCQKVKSMLGFKKVKDKPLGGNIVPFKLKPILMYYFENQKSSMTQILF